MTVRVLYFAGLRDLAGLREETFSLDDGASLADLQAAIVARHPDLVPVTNSIRWAVNETYADADASLSEEDSVAAIPPVSGG